MQKGQLNPSKYKKEFFDVITSIEVIEHINNPLEEALNISAILRSGGIFYCTTPNFNSLSRYILGNKWNIINYPGHLCYYTRKSILRLFKDLEFKKISIETTGFSITRFKTSLPRYKSLFDNTDQKYVSPTSDDEILRSKIEKYRYLRLIKYLVNKLLTMTGTGDTIKAVFLKPEKKTKTFLQNDNGAKPNSFFK